MVGCILADAQHGCALQVLTTGFWPTYKVQDIDLPKEMLDSQAQFKVRTVLASLWSEHAHQR